MQKPQTLEAPQPGIDVSKRRTDETIFVETIGRQGTHLYEITILDPSQGVVEVNSTWPALHHRPRGQYVHGLHVQNDHQHYPYLWIAKGMRLVFRFANGFHITGTVMSGSVSGEGWKYDVF